MGGRVRWLTIVGLALAVLLVLAGVTVIYWPAAVVIAGVGLGAVCLLVDLDQRQGDRE